MSDFAAAVTQVWEALRAVVVVNPALAALWLGSAVALAALLVYAWRRLVGP